MYIVTGAAGFIGSNIVKMLNERGITDILAVDNMTKGDKFRNLADCQIADYMDADLFLEHLVGGSALGPVTAILHQGACADTMENDGRYMMENNFTYSKEVFNYAIEHETPLVYASSASVYGMGRESDETPAFELPVNVYAYSKLAFDQYVRKNFHRVRSTVVGLRYFNVYGPREAQKGKMSSMVFQLYRQLKNSGVAKLFEGTDGYDNGEQLRDFVCVKDVVNVNLHFASQKNVQGIFNVGTGTARSFNAVADAIIKRLGGGKIEYVPFPDTLRGKYQNFTEAKLSRLQEAGYTEPFMNLNEGVEYASGRWNLEI